MRLFAGMSSTDYQDILRAVGLHIDEMGFRSVRIIEIEDGLVIQGLPSKESSSSDVAFETLLLTDNDLRQILVRAYRRRKTDPRSPASGP